MREERWVIVQKPRGWMIRILVFVAAAYGAYYFFSDETGCERYASKYSCSYVVNKASYDVYFWHNVRESDPKDEKFIGSTVGLRACLDLAMRYGASTGERWNPRAYICVLTEDGKNMEKHRYLE